MRLTKALGFGLTTILALMMLAGATSASADVIVVCKLLVEKGKLCPEGEYWPAKTKILALAKDVKLEVNELLTTCEDSLVRAETLASTGSPLLPILITDLQFGVLPAPQLGQGCIGFCTKGSHGSLPYQGVVEVTGEDDFWFRGSGLFEVLGCYPFILNCGYGAENLKVLIKNDFGEHQGKKGLAEIVIDAELKRFSGLSFACSATAKWKANYVVYGLESEGKEVQGWLALYKEF